MRPITRMDTHSLLDGVSPDALGRLVALDHDDPHCLLGLHGDVLRAWRPDAVRAALAFVDHSPPLPMTLVRMS